MSINNGSFVFRLFSILMFLTLLLSAVGITPVHGGPWIHYAKPVATGTGDCLSWTNACTLQKALELPGSGSTNIWVMAGIHKPIYGIVTRYSTFQLKNEVAVYGGFDGSETALSERDSNPATNGTILSGDIDPPNAGLYHVVTGASGATLDGFTITGGDATGASPNNSGGGIYNINSSPTLANLIFSGNSAEYGGGMYNSSSSSPTLTNVTFSGNSATKTGGGGGGGMCNEAGSSPTLTNVTFSGNSSDLGGNGGGMSSASSSNPILTNVTFSDNTATYGAGMSNINNSPTLTNVTFNGNHGGYGGGMQNTNSSPTLTNVTFSANKANESGGGMYNEKSSPTLTNVTFSGNSAAYGGGIRNFGSSPTLKNVTFSGNSAHNGGGMYNGLSGSVSSSPQISNTIFWGNTASISGMQIENKDSTSTLSDSVVQDGCPAGSACPNIISADPKLGVLGDYGGFTQTIPLLSGSSAIDTGNDAICPATDQRGVTRPIDGDNNSIAVCDIGAYEYIFNPWYGSVSITSNKNVVAVGRPHVDTEVASYSGFSAGAPTAYVPMLFKNAFDGTYDSALYIQNVDSSVNANVTIKYYNSLTGALTCTDTDTIKPLASKGYWLPTLSATECLPSGLPVGWVGSVVVTSSTTANVVANGRPHIGGEVMTYDSFSSGSLTSYLPMLFNGAYGGDYNSAFYVQNVDSSVTANVTIKYYNSATGALTCTDTDTIAPNTSTGYWLPTLSAAECLPAGLPAGWVGGVVVTSSAAPIVTVGRPHVGSQITTYNGFASGGLSSYVPMLFRKAYGGTYDSALYVQNVGVVPAAITIKYYDSATGALTCTDTDTIAPLSSKGYWLPTLPATECTGGGLPDNWVGGVVVTSATAKIVAIGRPHIGAQVTTYNGFTSGSGNSYLPMLFKNMWGTYNSAFYIQNTETAEAAVTVKFYDVDGNLSCILRDSIHALSTQGYWVPDVICE